MHSQYDRAAPMMVLRPLVAFVDFALVCTIRPPLEHPVISCRVAGLPLFNALPFLSPLFYDVVSGWPINAYFVGDHSGSLIPKKSSYSNLSTDRVVISICGRMLDVGT